MIYLLRHGQTEFNLEGRFQGHLDSPLTDLGVAQASAMGRRVATLIPQPEDWRIIASPLGRAQATARIVADALTITAIETDPRLIEITVGRWDGRLRAEVEQEAGPSFAASGWDFRSPDGETFDSTAARTRDWLESLPPDAERRIIAVSHGVTSRVLRGVYAGLSREESLAQAVPQDAFFRLKDGQVTRIET